MENQAKLSIDMPYSMFKAQGNKQVISSISAAKITLQNMKNLVCYNRIIKNGKVVAYNINAYAFTPNVVRDLLDQGYAIQPLYLGSDKRILCDKSKFLNQQKAQVSKKIGKALPCNIYKHKGEDCSNHGISSRYDEILLICKDGFVDVDLNDPPENLCKVVARKLFGDTVYLHVEPYEKPQHIGWMAGGTLIYSSDARFDRLSKGHPLSFHDRQETQELYDRLSH